ncbi:hypothetical protein [Marinoscillum sp.]|uniref:hypothetical protein n=1 Tax=Marinoscillum sp. TaxID=2024838 RepID=UPI003BAD5F5F
MKYLKSLKNKLLAAFPIIGPHADIEAEMMLAGKKPVTWMFVMPDDGKPRDIRIKLEQEGRKKLDQAVKEGKLVSIDVEQRHPQAPNGKLIFRHYAQKGNEKSLKRISTFNKEAFNGLEHTVQLDKDIGYYLGYRKRDIFFFNHVINSSYVPSQWKVKMINMNSYCQRAFQETQLEKAGYNLKEWDEYIREIESTLDME